MEEKSFGLLNTKNPRLFLKAGGLGGAQGLFLGQEFFKHLLQATAGARVWVSCHMALLCCPEMEPQPRSSSETPPSTSSPRNAVTCCTPRLWQVQPCVNTEHSFLPFWAETFFCLPAEEENGHVRISLRSFK